MSEKQKEWDFPCTMGIRSLHQKPPIKSEYSVAVWGVEFFKIDKDGNDLLNNDGSTKLFYLTSDHSYLADFVDLDDLVEIEGQS